VHRTSPPKVAPLRDVPKVAPLRDAHEAVLGVGPSTSRG